MRIKLSGANLHFMCAEFLTEEFPIREGIYFMKGEPHLLA